MSAHQRRRLGSTLARCLFTTGITGSALGCGLDRASDPPPTLPGAETPQQPDTAQERIDFNLDRLAALEILTLGDVAVLRTEHQWVPYGGTWSSQQIEMDAEEQADRIQTLADTAEQAVAGIDADDISGFGDSPTSELCYKLEPGRFCLTIDALADNLARINELEIVSVSDIVRSAPAGTGYCYSSWETVGEDDCVRALELGAIVDATREFPSSVPPEDAPE